LSVEQAQRNFDALVTQDSTDKSNSDEDENSESWDTGSQKSWEALGITSSTLLRNLQHMNYPSPLAVQDKACPSIITGNDVLVGTYIPGVEKRWPF
jgi:superfamily II DNA/RNA helicase